MMSVVSLVECLLSLALGIYLGRVWISRKKSLNAISTTQLLSAVSSEVTVVLQSLSTLSSAITVTEVPSTQSSIVFISTVCYTGYETSIETAKSGLLSIIGLNGSSKHEKAKYSGRPWSLMPSGSTSYLWTCRSDSDGIILRTSLFVKRSAQAVLSWLINQNITTGLEDVSEESSTVIESYHGGTVVLKRICFKGSLTASKRDFIIVTSISVLPDGTYIISSRSTYAPESASPPQRRCKYGFIRGIIYASGFVLRPVESSNGTGCEVFLAAHLDMLGSSASGGAANSSKLDCLALSVGTLMERIDTICTEDGEHMGDKAGMPVTVYRVPSSAVKSNKPVEPVMGDTDVNNINSLEKDSHKGESSDILITSLQGRIKLTANQITNLHSASYFALTRLRHIYDSLSSFLSGVEGLNRGEGSYRGEKAVSPKYSAKQTSYPRASPPREKEGREGAGGREGREGVWGARGSLGSGSHSPTSSHRPRGTSESSGDRDGGRDGNGTGWNMKGTCTVNAWELLLDSEGVSVYESVDSSNGGTSIYLAHCTIQASPVDVRKLLTDRPEVADSTLSNSSLQRRFILTKLDEDNSLQFLSYSPSVDSPVDERGVKGSSGDERGMRAADYLVVSGEEPYGVDGNGDFVSASCSVDDICEESDEADNTVENIFRGDTAPIAESIRSRLIVGGYIGVEDGSGGTVLSYVFESDGEGYKPLPAWRRRMAIEGQLRGKMRKVKDAFPVPVRGLRLVPVSDGSVSALNAGCAFATIDSNRGVGQGVGGGVGVSELSSGSLVGRGAMAPLPRIQRGVSDDRVQSVGRGGTIMRAVSSLINPKRDGSDSPCAPSSPKSPHSPKGGARALLSYVSGKSRGANSGKDTASDVAWRESNSLRGRAHSADDENIYSRGYDDEVKDARDTKERKRDRDNRADKEGVLSKGAKHRYSSFDNEYAAEEGNESPTEKDLSSETCASLSLVSANSNTGLSYDMGRLSSELDIRSLKDEREGVSPFEGVSMRRKDRKLSVHAVHPCGPLFIQEGVRLLRIYLGLDPQVTGEEASDFSIEWQFKGLKRGVRVESTMVARSTWQAIKAVCAMHADKRTVLDLLIDNSRMGEFDDMFDYGTLVSQVDERTVVRRLCFKPVWPTAPRDFLCCTTWMELQDGSLLVCTRSAPEVLLPHQKGYVRGSIRISGYFIQPCEVLDRSDPCYFKGGCKVTLTAHTDLGGSLPASVINMLSTAAPLKMMAAIADIVARH